MKKIDFKKPKYVLPLIVLPFSFLLNYLYLETFPPATALETKHGLQETDEIITTLPDANLEKKGINNKLGAGLEEHKYTTDYSAIQELEEEGGEQQPYGSVYTDKEKRMLDSINNAILTGRQSPEFMSQVQERQNANRNRYAATAPAASSRPRFYQKSESAYEKEMRLFKEQMRFIDSLGKADEEQAKGKKAYSKAAAPPKAAKEQAPEPLAVRKTANPNAAYFNTVRNDGQEQFIKAILDEGLKVREGGRIRIRLLDDIYVRDYEIEKGAYLYGIVSGFNAQRVEITVSSLLYGNQIIPVDLSIYDNDGLAGLYVPGSQFREFTRQLASNTTSGQTIDFGDNPENTNQMLFSMMDKMAQTTTRAVGKAVKQNKAKLKYNTIVYLIDNKAKKL
ncbi:conjugative transposon protein TraM [Adhaeribacter rhizoryzae]|uniref:Conjugative transposon protein TraM n=1 Tax=Adhaeribacter rhizoryzae TaxID=2607907 RepID=A0A5M6CW14_9BACT|nr:conjugative transposon protein TraM [Adhaeribacter rhizoryzae]KAA5539146.1 conjugative transposon protein TraM [Adhaeribacter rhizoryzae]